MFAHRMALYSGSILKIEFYCCFMRIHMQTLNVAYLCSTYTHRITTKKEVNSKQRLQNQYNQIKIHHYFCLIVLFLFCCQTEICLQSKSFSFSSVLIRKCTLIYKLIHLFSLPQLRFLFHLAILWKHHPLIIDISLLILARFGNSNASAFYSMYKYMFNVLTELSIADFQII